MRGSLASACATPHFLARGTDVETAFPVKPMCAGLGDVVRPALAPIEFGDELEPAIVCGVQVSSQFGDLRFEFAQWKTGFAARRSTVHDALHVPVYIYSSLPKKT